MFMCLGYDTKLHLLVRLELWEVWRNLSLPLLPSQL